jgi:microfibrillar-associated protein 1
MAKSFGRDELNALMGGGGQEEMAAFRPSVPKPSKGSSTHNPKEEVDFSKLSAAETAALLLEKGNSNQQQQLVNNSLRYRAKNSKKKMAHHELLEEELSKEQQQMKREQALREKRERELQQAQENEEEDDEDDEFVRKRQPSQAAVMIRRRTDDDGAAAGRRRRRAYDSSSSSSDDDSDAPSKKRKQRRRESSDDKDGDLPGRRRRADSSDSSSDDEDDNRRRRVLASRKAQTEPAVVNLKGDAKPPLESKQKIEKEVDTATLHPAEVVRNIEPKESSTAAQQKAKPRGDSSSTSSSGSSSDGSSDSSSDSSDINSIDEDEPGMPKVKFIPKHKRSVVISEEKKLEKEEKKLELQKEQKQKRKLQSRAMVAKQLAENESSRGEEVDDDDEAGGATNAMPNDDDDIDKEKEYNTWELRELGRVLRAIEEAAKRKQDQEEYQRRRKMTDAECLEEDMKLGRYQAPGANRQNGDPEVNSKHLQRFYHRGAYYMDNSEWSKDDIRQKAAEYARAATGEDKIDKSKLPKVMQVKGFGKARQNQKYKGLASEDTTDKSTRFLPLFHGSKHKKN